MKIRRAIIVEDDELMVSYMKSVLAPLGLDIQVFKSAENFLLNPQRYPKRALYLLDFNLPGLNGKQIIQFIRNHDRYSPIFIISGENNVQRVNECLEAGADDYLFKPVDPRLLVAKLKRSEEKLSLLQSVDDELELDLGKRSISLRGKQVSLTIREFNVVQRFLEAPEKHLMQDELMTKLELRNTNSRVSASILISLLRKKIYGLGLEIKTIRGNGYKLLVPCDERTK